MQMQKEIQFADNVILLDVGFLNGMANGLKNVLRKLDILIYSETQWKIFLKLENKKPQKQSNSKIF